LIIDDGWQQIENKAKEDANVVVQEGAQYGLYISLLHRRTHSGDGPSVGMLNEKLKKKYIYIYIYIYIYYFSFLKHILQIKCYFFHFSFKKSFLHILQK
jgi:hypothetical protein